VLRCFQVLVSIASFSACNQLPEVSYVTDRLHIATEFDDPICDATLEGFDEHVASVEKALGRASNRDPILVYWLDNVDEQCGKDRYGCFFPGTRVLFSTGPSITHEIVHAVLDSTARTYFVEEGMAEMYSGVDVWHRADPKHDHPASELRLTPSAYRDGKLDYAAAAHFMRFVYDTEGDVAMRELAQTIVAGGDAKAIEDTLEQSFDAPIEEIEQRYFDESRPYYRGFAAQEIAVADELSVGLDMVLDCDDGETRGPLISGGGGLYRVRRVLIDRGGLADIEVHGDSGGWVDIFDPTARNGIVTNWGMPRIDVDPHALHLVPGDRVQQQIQPGTYLAVFGAETDNTELTLKLSIPLPPVPHPQEAG
jgi:hypothetical protein